MIGQVTHKPFRLARREEVADSLAQNANDKRFRNKIAGPSAECSLYRGAVIAAGEHENRNGSVRLLFSDGGAYLRAVNIGQNIVQQNEILLRCFTCLDRFYAVTNNLH